MNVNGTITAMAASSLRTGGSNILLADGSVRFVKDTIDSGDVRSGQTGVWQKLATRNGGGVVDASSF